MRAVPLVHEFVRMVASLEDATLRAVRVEPALSALSDSQRAHLVRALSLRACHDEPDAVRVLLAFVSAHAKKLLAGAVHTPAEHEGDWRTGRPLTLGERKNLARRPQRAVIERALFDAHPDVIAELLRNPRLTELDVVRMITPPQRHATVLLTVASHAAWMTRERVRVAMVSNPFSHPHIASMLVATVPTPVLRELRLDTRVDVSVTALATDVLLHRRAPSDADVPPGTAGD